MVTGKMHENCRKSECAHATHVQINCILGSFTFSYFTPMTHPFTTRMLTKVCSFENVTYDMSIPRGKWIRITTNFTSLISKWRVLSKGSLAMSVPSLVGWVDDLGHIGRPIGDYPRTPKNLAYKRRRRGHGEICLHLCSRLWYITLGPSVCYIS